jgi:hypothetical protein
MMIQQSPVVSVALLVLYVYTVYVFRGIVVAGVVLMVFTHCIVASEILPNKGSLGYLCVLSKEGNVLYVM